MCQTRRKKGRFGEVNTDEKRLRQERRLKCLDILATKARHQHDALWEEEKHYSWWVYSILAGVAFLAFNRGINIRPVELRLAVVIIGAILGICLSITAFRVIRREGEYFWKTRKKGNSMSRAVGIRDELFDGVQGEPNKSLWQLISAIATLTIRDKCLEKKSEKKPEEQRRYKFGIRDFFQMTFLLTTAIFIAIIPLSVVFLFDS